MNESQINWRGGVVTHWDLDELEVQKDVFDQLDLFKEDLALVLYGSDVVLGLGWYPEFQPHGRFVVQVAVSEDWEKPVLHLEARDVAKLIEHLNEGASFASNTADKIKETN